MVRSDEQKTQAQTHDLITQAEPKPQTRLNKSKCLPDVCEYQVLQRVSQQVAQLRETQKELEAYNDEGYKTQIKQEEEA